MPDETSITTKASVLTAHVRPFVMLALVGGVIAMALMGNKDAMTALIGAFSVLVGALWGERAALKIPGVEQ